ncbi:MAG TPA: VWA domain-containing protein [Bryobacteraceae bacterium]|nr:VWA domain-containing protein [Bryobacteraceae bacterium]
MRALAILLVIVLAVPLAGQNPILFSTTTQLVIETVSVTDKSGDPVHGLSAKDFTITENGVPQQIRFFEEQQLPEKTEPPLPRSSNEQIHLYDKLTPTQIMPEVPGSNRFRNRRLLAFYFDMTAMPPTDQSRALAAAEKFIRTQITAADMVAILRYSGGALDVLQDFTDDRNRLLSILQTMVIGEREGFDESGNDASTPDAGLAFGQDDAEFNIFNTDRQLAALETAAKMLAPLQQKKSLIYFASGLKLNGLNNQAQLHATENAALRAGVSFWPIDARGLVAEPPIGDATKASPGTISMYSGASAQALTTNFQLSQDTLYALASDTGGKALLDYNDLTRGIVNAQHAVSSYYIIGYYSTLTARDGRFRRVKVAVNEKIAAKLDYRQGYYADKEFSKFTVADRERQLEDALMQPNPITDLTIAMEVDYFQLNRAEYFVPIIVKIPGRELALAKRRGAEHTLIDFIGEIKDAYGITVTNVRDKVNIKLSDETAAQLAKRPIEYDSGFTLLPGKYTIKFLARDDETGRIGTYQTTFEIPNLNKEVKRVAISSVILSSQRVAMKEALYNAKNKVNEDDTNPLMQDGQKVIPSVTRVFKKSRPVSVYLQAYEQGSPAIKPLIAFVTLYAEEKKVFESAAVEATRGKENTVKAVPLQLGLDLSNAAPGMYVCQVSVLEPAEQKAAFWRVPIAIVP